ncbi:MAG: pyridoxal phosphate-dependent aminotransferase [Gemmatimonadota bacterium]|nr:MAG: pyridoxal phosphate-dependent aminotransferase [Gemmatimonadota bacterium]
MTFSANIAQLQPSATLAVSSLAKRLRSEGRDIIDLSAGEPDFDTPSFISERAIEGIRAGQTRYTPASGMPELRAAIADQIAGVAGREIAPGDVVVTSGGKQALFNAAFVLFGPGDDVLVATPYWTSYPQIVHLTRATPVFVRGAEENDFRLTPADLDAAATDRTRGLILCSPGNPTGAVYSSEELEAVGRWAKDRGIWLIADEIYRRIYFGSDRLTAASILELPEEALGPFVLVDGASKSFAMTGWRIGFLYSSPEVVKKVVALQGHTTSNAATPSQVAALAAFGSPEQADTAVAEMVAAFRRRRDLVAGLMSDLLPEFSCLSPNGAFYLFFRVDSVYREGCEGSTAFCSWLLEETGVALVPGVAFGDDRFVRMSFATDDALLQRAIERMATAVRGVRSAN